MPGRPEHTALRHSGVGQVETYLALQAIAIDEIGIVGQQRVTQGESDTHTHWSSRSSGEPDAHAERSSIDMGCPLERVDIHGPDGLEPNRLPDACCAVIP